MFRTLQRHLSLFVAVLVLLSGVTLCAQVPLLEEPGYTPTLTFDVATIRLAPPPDANFRVTVSSPPHSSRFEAKNLPIKALLQIAYGYDAPVVGAPDWVGNTFYNIQARSDEAADARLAKLTDNQVRLEKRNAIRVLLAERLELKTHLETRNTAIYNLVLAKGGLKMTPSPAPPPPADGSAPPPPPPVDMAAHGSQHGLEFVGKNVILRAITSSLSSMVEAPVVDKTGLTGAYNYTLQFGREWSANDPDSWPSIFTAVQEQLGLKLEATHETVPNLVVDHIIKPTEN
ncbi:soil-associated protein, TIGR03435 family [Bryocella elongata]|uniref:Soil-associated protein, TIGR03435 family n=1 Tax=Bryocella elongata TaxID=863522 RepID=A0A1H6AZI4_9BACT|nr:TIGR03435 family protein [Bryocella elongata]SEG54011.1 soil-associated protein, TIGR03435 family [Bryocella elongata]